MRMRLTTYIKKYKLWLGIIGLSTVAAILYYSWPLGYWLNPAIGRHGLASDLEATGQPFSWLFVDLDIASGVLVVIVSLWLARIWHEAMNLSIKLILIGYGLFGALTAFGALLPMNCLADERNCGSVVQDPALILHGIASIGSILGLTISIAGIWQLIVLAHRGNKYLHWLMHTIIIIWAGFGVLTLVLILTMRSSNTAQHVFITICSLWILLLPILLAQIYLQEHQN